MKKRKQSILQRAAQQAPRPKKQRTQSDQAAPRYEGSSTGHGARQQQRGGGGGGGGGSGAKHPRSAQQQQPKQPQGLRPVSAVHQQAAYAVRRLLEADASKRGGVTLKSLTLGPQVAAKKVRCCCIFCCVDPNSGWTGFRRRTTAAGCSLVRLACGQRGPCPSPTASATATCAASSPLPLPPTQATYAVTVEALKHYSVLQPLLERTQLVEQGRGLTQAVALVLAYELLWGEGLRPVGPAERAVLQRKVGWWEGVMAGLEGRE